MTWPSVGLRGLATDLKVGLLFCTRLPISSSAAIEGSDVARAGWAMPIAGAVVGALGGLSYWLAVAVGLPPMPAAMLALVTTMIVTGGLHEDGLADTADGFGGGSTRERKLAIMRDSRIGTFGVCALLDSVILRWSALVAPLAEPQQVTMALIAAQMSARATLPAFMRSCSARREPMDFLPVPAGLLGGQSWAPARSAALRLSSALVRGARSSACFCCWWRDCWSPD